MAFPNPPKTWAFQESVESSELNTELRDALLAIGNHYRLRKTADQSVTSSTVLVDCTDLSFAIGANDVWQFQQVFGLTCGATGGMRWTFTVPAAATGSWYQHGNDNITVHTWGTAFATEFSVGGAVTSDPFEVGGMVVNGANAGNVTFRFAQSVSNATPTTILQNSWLIAHRIG